MCRGGHVVVSSPLPSYGKNSGVTLLSCVGTCAFTHVGISRYSFTPFSQPALVRESGTGDDSASLTAPWRGPRRPKGTGE